MEKQFISPWRIVVNYTKPDRPLFVIIAEFVARVIVKTYYANAQTSVIFLPFLCGSNLAAT
ncbi:MAG: hypothetical protein JWR61_4293 [Ferruginibacter sp.]|nr:hypothetical protein [Ferruginibacter sp.]